MEDVEKAESVPIQETVEPPQEAAEPGQKRLIKIAAVAAAVVVICLAIGWNLLSPKGTGNGAVQDGGGTTPGQDGQASPPVVIQTSQDGGNIGDGPLDQVDAIAGKLAIPWQKVIAWTLIAATVVATAAIMWYMATNWSETSDLLDQDILDDQILDPNNLVEVRTSLTDMFLELSFARKVTYILLFVVGVITLRVLTLGLIVLSIWRNHENAVTPGDLKVKMNGVNGIEIVAGARIDSVFADILNLGLSDVDVKVYVPSLIKAIKAGEEGAGGVPAALTITKDNIYNNEFEFANVKIRSATLLGVEPMLEAGLSFSQKANLESFIDRLKLETEGLTNFENWALKYGYIFTGTISTTALGFPFSYRHTKKAFSLGDESDKDEDEDEGEEDQGKDGDGTVAQTKQDPGKTEVPLFGFLKATTRENATNREPQLDGFISLARYRIPLKITDERLEIEVVATHNDVQVTQVPFKVFFQSFNVPPSDFGKLPEKFKAISYQAFSVGLSLPEGFPGENFSFKILEKYRDFELKIQGKRASDTPLNNLLQTLKYSEKVLKIEEIAIKKTAEAKDKLLEKDVVNVKLKEAGAPKNPKLCEVTNDLRVAGQNLIYELNVGLISKEIEKYLPFAEIDLEPVKLAIKALSEGDEVGAKIGTIVSTISRVDNPEGTTGEVKKDDGKPTINMNMIIAIEDLSLLGKVLVKYQNSYAKLPDDVKNLAHLRIEGDNTVDLTNRPILAAIFKVFRFNFELATGKMTYRNLTRDHLDATEGMILERTDSTKSRMSKKAKAYNPLQRVILDVLHSLNLAVINSDNKFGLTVKFSPCTTEHFEGNNISVTWPKRTIKISFGGQELAKMEMQKGGLNYLQTSQAGGLAAIRGLEPADNNPQFGFYLPTESGNVWRQFINQYNEADQLEINVSVDDNAVRMWLPTKRMKGYAPKEDESKETSSKAGKALHAEKHSRSRATSKTGAQPLVPMFTRNLLSITPVNDGLIMHLQAHPTKSEEGQGPPVVSSINFDVKVDKISIPVGFQSDATKADSEFELEMAAFNLKGKYTNGKLFRLQRDDGSGIVPVPNIDILTLFKFNKIDAPVAKYIAGKVDKFAIATSGKAPSAPLHTIVNGFVGVGYPIYDKDKVVEAVPKEITNRYIFSETVGSLSVEMGQLPDGKFKVETKAVLPKHNFGVSIEPRTLWEFDLPALSVSFGHGDERYLNSTLGRLFLPIFAGKELVVANPEYSYNVDMKLEAGAFSKSLRTLIPQFDSEQYANWSIRVGGTANTWSINISKDALVELTKYTQEKLRSYIAPSEQKPKPAEGELVAPAELSPAVDIPAELPPAVDTPAKTSTAGDKSVPPDYHISKIVKLGEGGILPCPLDGMCPISDSELAPLFQVPVFLAKRLFSSIPNIYQSICSSLLLPALPKTLEYTISLQSSSPLSISVDVNNSLKLARIDVENFGPWQFSADMQELLTTKKDSIEGSDADKGKVEGPDADKGKVEGADADKGKVEGPDAGEDEAEGPDAGEDEAEGPDEEDQPKEEDVFNQHDYVKLIINIYMNKGDAHFRRLLKPIKLHPLHVNFSMDNVNQMLYSMWFTFSSSNQLIDLTGALINNTPVRHLLPPFKAPTKEDEEKDIKEGKDPATGKPATEPQFFKVSASTAKSDLLILKIDGVLPANLPYADIVTKLRFNIIEPEEKKVLVNMFFRSEGETRTTRVSLKSPRLLGPMIMNWIKGTEASAYLEVKSRTETLMTTRLQFSKENQFLVEMVQGIFDRMAIPPIIDNKVKDENEVVRVGIIEYPDIPEDQGGPCPLFFYDHQSTKDLAVKGSREVLTWGISKLMTIQRHPHAAKIEFGIRQTFVPKMLDLGAKLLNAFFSWAIPFSGGREFELKVTPANEDIPLIEVQKNRLPKVHPTRGETLLIKHAPNYVGKRESVQKTTREFLKTAKYGDYIDRANKLTQLDIINLFPMLSIPSSGASTCVSFQDKSRLELALGPQLNNTLFNLPLDFTGVKFPLTFGGFTDACHMKPFCDLPCGELPKQVSIKSNWKLSFNIKIDLIEGEQGKELHIPLNIRSADDTTKPPGDGIKKADKQKSVNIRFYPILTEEKDVVVIDSKTIPYDTSVGLNAIKLHRDHTKTLIINGKHLEQINGVLPVNSLHISIQMIYKAHDERIHIRTTSLDIEDDRGYYDSVFPLNLQRALTGADNITIDLRDKSNKIMNIKHSDLKFALPKVDFTQTTLRFDLENLPKIGNDFAVILRFKDECGLVMIDTEKISCGLFSEKKVLHQPVGKDDGADVKMKFHIADPGIYTIKCKHEDDLEWSDIPNGGLLVTEK